MDLFANNRSILQPGSDCGAWIYERPIPDIVELATVRGSAVALPTHFHEEDQITFVISGKRRFRLGCDIVERAAGTGIFIPAGVPHASLDEPEGVACFNVYLAAESTQPGRLIQQLSRLWESGGHLPVSKLAELVRAHQCLAPASMMKPRNNVSPLVPGRVGDAAARADISRESFSRKFRKKYGVPPSVFFSFVRLNDARRLLRSGEALAIAAAEAGFADQSHLGRHFLRAFGVTPGRYRASCRRSHSFQTTQQASS